jgi:NTP pyrophosphatase (non-canonical NTP hydrolase)
MPLARRKKSIPTGQILMFPGPDDSQPAEPLVDAGRRALTRPVVRDNETSVVVSGSFRRDIEGLKMVVERFRDLGCHVLSPVSVDVQREIGGFVFMRGEEGQAPEVLERRHLDAIEQADFVWLHAPGGYVGLSGSLEIGYAAAVGTPVYTDIDLGEPTLQPMVKRVERLEQLLPKGAVAPPTVPKPAVTKFQNYYKKVAVQRGYEKESAQNCLLLMIEEIGELARGLRKDEKLERHHASTSNSTQELADVFIYVIHMANILNADLGEVVRDKELSNWSRFFERAR